MFPIRYSAQRTVDIEPKQLRSRSAIQAGTAIVDATSVIYVLDNEPFTIAVNGAVPSPRARIPARFSPLPWAPAARLQAEPSGVIPDAATLSNPIDFMVESKSKFVYVANQGNNVTGPNPESGIAGYFLTTAPGVPAQFRRRPAIRLRIGPAVYRRGSLQPVHLRSQPI